MTDKTTFDVKPITLDVKPVTPQSLQLLNINKIVFTDDNGEVIMEIKSSADTLIEFFKRFDFISFGYGDRRLVFKYDPYSTRGVDR